MKIIKIIRNISENEKPKEKYILSLKNNINNNDTNITNLAKIKTEQNDKILN